MFSIIFFFQHHDKMQRRGYFHQVEYFHVVECSPPSPRLFGTQDWDPRVILSDMIFKDGCKQHQQQLIVTRYAH